MRKLLPKTKEIRYFPITYFLEGELNKAKSVFNIKIVTTKIKNIFIKSPNTKQKKSIVNIRHTISKSDFVFSFIIYFLGFLIKSFRTFSMKFLRGSSESIANFFKGLTISSGMSINFLISANIYNIYE